MAENYIKAIDVKLNDTVYRLDYTGTEIVEQTVVSIELKSKQLSGNSPFLRYVIINETMYFTPNSSKGTSVGHKDEFFTDLRCAKTACRTHIMDAINQANDDMVILTNKVGELTKKQLKLGYE